ncbi:MAG: proton-conducting transporter membrane subunit [Eubacteriales bacterium]|nr:proton-conducting transporter membrane subunit [Eubacteriales bacterium]
MQYIVISLLFLIPLSAALLPAIGVRSARILSLYVICSAALTLITAVIAGLAGDFTVTLINLTPSVSVSLASDGFSRLFALIAASVWLIVSVYAAAYMRHDENKVRFFAFFLVVQGTLMLMIFSGNIFTMFIFMVMTAAASVPPVFHRVANKNDVGPGYIVYLTAGILCVLFGVWVFCVHGAGNFSPGGTLLPADNNLLRAAAFVSVIGFGVFPLLKSLSAVYNAAPAPAAAVLSGVVSSGGVFCAIRVIYFTVGTAQLRGTWVQNTLIALALLTITAATVMAFREKLLKRSIAYQTVAQSSLALLGAALMTPAAAEGALLQLIYQSVAAAGLFMAAGVFSRQAGLLRRDDLLGMGRRMPAAMICFTLLSLSVIGIPPMLSFNSKWFLVLATDSRPVQAVIFLHSLLSAGYLLPTVISAYFPGIECDPNSLTDAVDAGRTITLPLFILAAGPLFLGINASVITDAVRSLIF